MKVETEKLSKVFGAEELVIEAPIEVVFDYVRNIRVWPQWQEGVESTLIEGKPMEGTTFSWRSGGVKISSRLHTVNPPFEFGWTGRFLWISAIHNWEFKDLDGNCLVRVEESMKGVLSEFFQKSMVKGLRKSLQELKRVAENDQT